MFLLIQLFLEEVAFGVGAGGSDQIPGSKLLKRLESIYGSY